MIQAVIFDMDDTLLQSRKTKIPAFQLAGKEFYNLDISEETIRKHWGEPTNEFYEAVFEHKADVKTLVANYLSVTNQFPNVAYPDAVELVHRLAKHFPIGLLTSSPRAVVENDLKIAGFQLQDFMFIQSSEDTNAHKPDPTVFEPILAKLAEKGIKAANVLYVGDSLRDVAAAQGAGLEFLGVVGNTTSSEQFAKHKAETIENLNEVLEKVPGIKKAANTAM